MMPLRQPPRCCLAKQPFLRGLGAGGAALWILVGGMARSAAAQQPAKPASSGFINGRVVDDSARGLVGAEVVVLASGLKALTGPDGQFRLERVPVGRWSILVRAIGFLPHSRVVDVDSRGVSLGVVSLHAAATLLPELEVTARIPSPPSASGSPGAWRNTVRRALYGAITCRSVPP